MECCDVCSKQCVTLRSPCAAATMSRHAKVLFAVHSRTCWSASQPGVPMLMAERSPSQRLQRSSAPALQRSTSPPVHQSTSPPVHQSTSPQLHRFIASRNYDPCSPPMQCRIRSLHHAVNAAEIRVQQRDADTDGITAQLSVNVDDLCRHSIWASCWPCTSTPPVSKIRRRERR